MGVPVRPTATAAVAVGAGYGWLDTSGAIPGGHRYGGQLAAAASVGEHLLIGLDARGRSDTFTAGPDELNLYGEPRISGRYFAAIADSTQIGAEVDVRILGAEAPSVELAATSPSVSALLGHSFSPTTLVGVQLGLHWDRSADAVPSPARVSNADRRTLQASSWSAVRWSAGISQSLSKPTEFIAEVGGDWLVGAGSPQFLNSPMSLALGVRHALNANLAVLGRLDASLSARPDSFGGADLLPVEPRLGATLNLTWQFGHPKPAPTSPAPAPVIAAKPKPKPAAPSEPVVVTNPVRGTVVDEGGRPLSDVLVVLERQGAEPMESRSFADGSFTFDKVPKGPVKLQLSTPGFEGVSVDVADSADRNANAMLRPAVPAGQVKGHILDLQGSPIDATVQISPGDQTLELQPDGSFTLELPPGDYTLRFQHPKYRTQSRSVKVHDRGVVILNIALTR